MHRLLTWLIAIWVLITQGKRSTTIEESTLVSERPTTRVPRRRPSKKPIKRKILKKSKYRKGWK